MKRRLFLAALGGVAVSGLAFTPAFAGKPAVYTSEIEGVGAGGYDVVAYQTKGEPVKGNAGIVAEHDGVKWRFASTANRDAFRANPSRYAPQFGGYCAWAVAQGYTAHGDPEAWSVVDGKLFLNYSKSIRSRWQKDVPGNISKGAANWPKVLE